MPRMSLKKRQMGIEPPEPISTVSRRNSSFNALDDLAMKGLSSGISVAGLPPPPANSTLQSFGISPFTNFWKAFSTLSGFCLPTRRKVNLACALEGSTVLMPTPV